MRILHIAASMSHRWGGPPRVIRGLTEGIARRGHEVCIFTAETDDEAKLLQPQGVKVFTFEQDVLSVLWTAHSHSLAKELRRAIQDFDLVHIHEIWHHPHYVAARAAMKAKKPYIITPHGALEPWRLNYKGLKKKVFTLLTQKRILEGAAVIHAISRDEVRHIQSFGVRSPIVVIPNGVCLEEFQSLPPREEFEEIYPEISHKEVLLFLGRIHPMKGLDILAKAFGRIARRGIDVHLLIVGPDDGSYRAHVEELLESEGVRNKVTFTGMLTGREKMAALSRADVFVLPSYSEGFSMAVLEAMACGLPVIVTHQCHFPQVAEAGAGLVIDPDPEQLASALVKVLDNPEMRREMGIKGRRLVSENFTWDKMAERMLQLYEDVLEGKVSNDHKIGLNIGLASQ